MSDSSVSHSMRIKWRDSTWLVIAVLLHAALLLMPLRQSRNSPEPPRPINVLLVDPVRSAPETEEPALIENTVEKQPLAAVPRTLPEEIPPPERLATPGNLSAARLLDSMSQFEWALPEKKSKGQLGVFTPRPLPENWRPRIIPTDTIFNGRMLPQKTGILDRWLAADGSQNVVINTPRGDTLCGRAEPWNPMSPLVEPVMMFRPCAGGGRRTFSMPDRYMRSQGNAGRLR